MLNPDPSSTDQSNAFEKTSRLLTSKDYSKVFDNVDHRVSSKHFLILASQNDGLGTRLGIIVAKKHVKLAVQRNRIKRLMREAFRLRKQRLENLDLVVLAKHGCGQLDNASCNNDFNYLFRKLNKKLKAN